MNNLSVSDDLGLGGRCDALIVSGPVGADTECNGGWRMRLIFSWLLLLSAPALLDAALIPPSFINSVVAIGQRQPNPGGAPTWITEASGFFYGYLTVSDPDPAKRGYEIYLVTNRHVVDGRGAISVRLNPKGATDQGQVFEIPKVDERGSPTWFFHADPGIDIAAARVNPKFLQDRKIDYDFMTSDTQSADVRLLKDIGVSAGDGVFVLGFPMNLAGQRRNYVIVRRGAIARISDLMESVAPTMLIDSQVFPGNSGGPVLLEPSALAINGTKSSNMAYLIGVVKSYITYVDTAISPLTQHARVSFEENSGLAEAVPVDRINEAIKAWRGSLPPSPPVPLKTLPTGH